MKKIIILSLVTIALFSCNINNIENKNSECNISEQLVLSTVWYQKSAESRALYYQIFSFAKLSLDLQIEKQKDKNNLAVILDIDETVLDNSPYQSMLIKNKLSYTPKTWKEWTNLGVAKALPGVLDFVEYAISKNCNVFFVSNRDTDELAPTLENLINEGFTWLTDDKLLLRENKVSNKEPRFEKIQKDYNVILYLGDNLKDFGEIFGNRKDDLGFNVVDSLKNKFGMEYVVFANPMYGEWEKAIYSNCNIEDKSISRKEVLEVY